MAGSFNGNTEDEDSGDADVNAIRNLDKILEEARASMGAGTPLSVQAPGPGGDAPRTV